MKNPWKSSSKVNPQTEKGTRRIANDLWLALTMIDLTVTELKIILAIVHCTWGFRKLDSQISYGFLSILTGKHRTTVMRATKKLVARRILVIDNQVVAQTLPVKGTKLVAGTLPVNRFMLNKYYDTWLDKSGSVYATSSQVNWWQRCTQTSSKRDGKLVARTLPIKESSIKKEIKGVKKSQSPETELEEIGQKFLEELGVKSDFLKTEKTDKRKLDKKDLEF